MAMVYDIQKAAEILGTTVEEIEENIRQGTISAEWKEGRWEIPEWSIRVFVRTREALRKLNRRSALDRNESEYDLLTKILAKLEDLADFQDLQLKWIEQLDTLRFRIRELEEELSYKEFENAQLRKELELQSGKPEEGLKRLEDRYRELFAFLSQEISQLHDRMAKMEEELQKIQRRDVQVPVPSVSKNSKEGFWDRLIRMLTWD
ncbi:hypothetical protein [Thermodesulforhabdus norvegica]|uniref:Helix-turn-helix domain-containing protein n=1 Tax=Thermodesulforhabdus norvegica TaxID=39841 RepID=A0A1I4QZG8_9BACT|nr:hypothetical protein [Thermodesulforhabdus norvegica]SFM45083.1 hypothetical protein SAMN05660836_00296 [Thermodesulforhabdus norvegica]